jgi:uncharacterized protein (DUF1330 family)
VQALESLPAIRAAAEDGKLSAEQLEAVASGNVVFGCTTHHHRLVPHGCWVLDGDPEQPDGLVLRELDDTSLALSFAAYHQVVVPAYVIYQGEVLDPDRYEGYKPKSAASIHDAGGRFLVRGGDVEVLEGDAPPQRTVVLEFPTRDAAVAWYRGQQYAEARAIREGAARAHMYVVDGVD